MVEEASEFQPPILVTSGGQSADYQMISTVMGKKGMDFTTNNQGNGFIEAAHSGKGNVGFWDGHVDVLAPTQLAQIGAYSSGTNYAYVLEPAKGGITVLYSNLKRRSELF